ncbi:MAG TPA: DUF5317 domain-containing protein [Pseudothermotoga sp.]|nr:DUF5317 domain-containing protein [Pseudothermotoga sp.]HOK83983.1 DUF5317 domain-containing protein [Pseudothermotoga sp.]HPP70966.1 DUF5317 domain-containing protein [Pseudothermotoga sp.]
MILDVFIIALVLSFILKKRVYYLDTVRIKLVYLFVVPFVIQMLPLNQRGFLMAISYGLLFLILTVNRNLRGFKLMAIGSVMNAFVILLNNGRMPAYEPFAKALNLNLTIKHVFVEKFSARLLLGDWIPIILPWGRRFLISPGDIFIYIGVFIFLLTKHDLTPKENS